MPGLYWKLREFLNDTNRQPNNIIAGRDGRLYEIRDSALGRIVLHKQEVKKLDEIQEGFQFGLPKIPGELLSIILSFFRRYCTELEQNEVMVQIFYDTEERKYFLECPFQRVCKDLIDADVGAFYNHSRYIEVAHIHSHNTYRAIFSKRDNEHELKFMLYGVVGTLLDEVPEMMLRVGARGEFIYMSLDYIFENPILTPTEHSYPKEWDDRVTIVGGGSE